MNVTAANDDHIPESEPYEVAYHLKELIYVFLRYHRNGRLHALSIFLIVAEYPGITMEEIGRKTRRAQSSVWRNVSSLSDESDLLYTLPDPAVPQRKLVYLTEKGVRLAAEFQRCYDSSRKVNTRSS